MDRWSLRIGSLFGIPCYLHWTFLLLVAWLLVGPIIARGPIAAPMALRSVGFVLTVFACILFHELGHALAARLYGIRTRDITLLPIGGIARLERMPEKPGQELVVALAGPMVNVIIATVLIPVVLVVDGLDAFALPQAEPGRVSAAHAALLLQGNFLAAVAMVNVFLVLFNMVPALPMDGGRVLRSLLAMALPRHKATAAAATLGQVVAVLFVLLGLFTGNIFLMLIGAFVFVGAGAEAQAEQFRTAIEGLPARAAMLTRFRTLRASDTLRRAADELLAGSQQDFPVLADDAIADDDGSALLGVLTRTDLVRAVAQGNLDLPIASVIRAGCRTVREEDDLRSALDRADHEPMDSSGHAEAHAHCPVIVVLRDDRDLPGGRRIVGLITPDNVSELVMLRSASGILRR
jgi:Zn-dependent protease